MLSRVTMGDGVVIHQPDLVNLYDCQIGAGSRIGAFVEIQRGAVIGERCKISSHSFICEGVSIDDEVFLGHGVMFTNDRYPRAVNADGRLQANGDWMLARTTVKARASIGSNVTILPGVTIGKNAFIGAGAVVTSDIPDGAVAAGVPARILKQSSELACRPIGDEERA